MSASKDREGDNCNCAGGADSAGMPWQCCGIVSVPLVGKAGEELWRAVGDVSCSELTWAARLTEPCNGCKAVPEKSKPETQLL